MALYVVVGLLYLIIKGLIGGGKSSGKGVSFSKVAGTSFPAYDGKVDVLVNVEPPEAAILVGSVYVTLKGTKDKLLKRMKARAARYGADTIILFKSDPETTKSGYLYWSAETFKTLGIEGATH